MDRVKEYKGFTVGEKIICILNNRASLTVGKEYHINSIEVHLDGVDFWISVINDNKLIQTYHQSRFINKSDFRKHLIDDILK